MPQPAAVTPETTLNPNSPLPPDNNAAEIAAFEATCRRLAGFDARLNTEFVDGFLCGLAAAVRRPPPDEWLPALAGDTFDRVFADPASHAEALAALNTRLAVLRGQLDAEALADDPDRIRLRPWMAEWTDDDRRQALADAGGEPDPEQAALLHTGAVWSVGFIAAIDTLPDVWTLPDGDAERALFADALDPIRLLALPEGGDDWRERVARLYPDGVPERDALVDDACLAAQDLRLLAVDFAPRPAPRRVEPTPGRNDPCPCGSGRKFKRCHGAG